MAPDLFTRLRRLGYVPGVPGHLAPSTIQADVELCRAAVGGGCGQDRGLTYLPHHRGPRYRIIAQCEACLHCEEF